MEHIPLVMHNKCSLRDASFRLDDFNIFLIGSHHISTGTIPRLPSSLFQSDRTGLNHISIQIGPSLAGGDKVNSYCYVTGRDF